MSDSMDIVSDKQPQQSAKQLTDGASEDTAGLLAAASSQTQAPAPAPATGIVSPTTPASASSKKRAAWNTPKYREEMDVLQSRFVDKSFNPADYGDPLTLVRPLNKFYEHQFSEEDKQLFAELEAEVDEHLAKEGGQ